MAAITNVNSQQEDEEKKNVNGPMAANIQNSSVSSTQQKATPGGQPPSSGRFTNIQSYLGANKGAGQQLGQNLQQGVEQKLGQTQSTAQKQLGQAQQQQQNTQNAYNQGWQQYQQLGGQNQVQFAPGTTAEKQQEFYQQYNANPANPQSLMQQYGASYVSPAQEASKQQTYSFATPEGNNAPKGVLASEYNADIGGRQQTTGNIASNEDLLKAFTGLRTGTTQQEQQKLMQEKNQAALDAANQFGTEQQGRVKQLGTETGRGGLLTEFVGNKNYNLGQRSLDSAFLQRDPNRSLDTLKQNIAAKAADVKALQGDVGTTQQQSNLLNVQGQDLSKQLGAQTKQNIDDYTANLESRIATMEQQRGQKMDWARQQLEDFKSGKGLNKEFLDLLGVKSGTQLFNVPGQVGDVGEILDTSDFGKNLNLQDVTNAQDVKNYENFAKLAGILPTDYQVKDASTLRDISQFGQGDERTLTNRAEAAKQQFIKDMASRNAIGNTGWVEGVKGYGSANMLDYLLNPDYYSRAGVTYQTREGDQFGANTGALTDLGNQLYGALGAYGSVNPLGLIGANQAGQTVGQALNQLQGAYNTPGGDIEKGAHLGLETAALPITLAPGGLGEFGRALTGDVQNLLSGFSGLFGGGGESRGDEIRKGMNYVKGRTIGYGGGEDEFLSRPTGQAIDAILAEQGFRNYMGDQGMQTATDSVKDIAGKFGYRLGGNSPTGFYNPELLRQLAATGGLENMPIVEG